MTRSSSIGLIAAVDDTENSMNKAELIDHIAARSDLSKAAATRALDSLVHGIRATLKQNGAVHLAGFGTFTVEARAARRGRNPKTGEALDIPATKVPRFRAGKALKDALN